MDLGPMPDFVTRLMRVCDPMLVGSRAQGTAKQGSDWDIIIPHGQWCRVRHALNRRYKVSATYFGGLRVESEDWSVDVFCCSVEEAAVCFGKDYFPHRIIDLKTGTSFLIEKKQCSGGLAL